MSLFETLNIPAGQSLLGAGLGFMAYSVRVDNFSNQWLRESTTASWIPPYTVGRVIRLNGTQVGQISNTAPTAAVGQLPAIAGEQSTALFYDLDQPDVPGINVESVLIPAGISKGVQSQASQVSASPSVYTDTGILLAPFQTVVGLSCSLQTSAAFGLVFIGVGPLPLGTGRVLWEGQMLTGTCSPWVSVGQDNGITSSDPTLPGHVWVLTTAPAGFVTATVWFK